MYNLGAKNNPHKPFIETGYRKFYRKLTKFPPKSGVSCRTSCSWFLRTLATACPFEAQRHRWRALESLEVRLLLRRKADPLAETQETSKKRLYGPLVVWHPCPLVDPQLGCGYGSKFNSRGGQVFVIGSIYQGSILRTYFWPTAMWCLGGLVPFWLVG